LDTNSFSLRRSPLIFIGAIVVLPLLALSYYSFDFSVEEGEDWLYFIQKVLPGVWWPTITLVFSTGIFAAILGTSAALSQFGLGPKLKKISHVLYLLPLAFPLYVLAFVYRGHISYSSAISTFCREHLGITHIFGKAFESPLAVGFVLALGLFPYVYLSVSEGLARIDKQALAAARTLGAKGFYLIQTIYIPTVLPWAGAGMLLVMLEVLADFGAVSIFNYDTFSTAIYEAWSGFFSIGLASRLGFVLLVHALIFFYVMERMRKRSRLLRSESLNPAMAASSKFYGIFTLLSITLFSFITPLGTILIWSLEASSVDVWSLSLGSIKLGVAVSLSVLGVGWICALSARGFAHSGVALTLCSIGYALPGSLLAVGVYALSTFFTESYPWLFLILGLSLRFLVVGIGHLRQALHSTPSQWTMAAKTLGASGTRRFFTLYWPMGRSVSLGVICLVFVEVIKEMPLTLMLRPHGMNSLAVKIFEYTSEGEWALASVPSVMIVVWGVVGVSILLGFEAKRSHEC
jgi:iron(III) transport system permease protein